MKNHLAAFLVSGDCIISRENSISIIKIVEKLIIKEKGTHPLWVYLCLRNITGEHKLQVFFKDPKGGQTEVFNRQVTSQSPKQLIHHLQQITVEGGKYGEYELYAYLDNELIGGMTFNALPSP